MRQSSAAEKLPTDDAFTDILAVPDLIARSVIAEDDAEPVWDTDIELLADNDESFVMTSPLPLRAPMASLAELSPPKERVRFSTGLELTFLGLGDVWAGAVLNLSNTGIACALSDAPKAGERVCARFRLSLMEAPIEVECVVIWARLTNVGQALVGLSFVRLPQDLSARIDAVVKERAEGRAAEWSLPLSVPKVTHAKAAAPSSRLLPVLLGLLGGVGLSFVASHLPMVDMTRAPVAPSASQVVAPKEDSLALVAVVSPDAPAAVATEKPENGTAATLGQANAPQSAEEGQATLALAAIPAATDPLAKATESAAPAADATALQPGGSKNRLVLPLVTDGPVEVYNTFWVDSPRRLVVDVQGRHSAFAQREYPIDHPLAKSLRIGAHEDKVRFVVETQSDTAVTQVEAHPEGHSLVLTLRP